MQIDRFAERVLTALQTRHILGVSEADHARGLIRSGLNLEQSVVGTGMVPSDVYAEQLGFVAGLPVVRAPQPLVDVLDPELTERCTALPFARHGRTVIVAFSRPEQKNIDKVRDALAQNDLACMPYVTPDSSLWRRAESLPKTLSLLNKLRDSLAKARSRHIRLIHEPLAIRAVADSGRVLNDVDLDASHIPAIAYRVKRLGKASGWLSEVTHLGLGVSIHLTLASDGDNHHPVNWSALENKHNESPEALTIVLASDPAFIRESFERSGGAEVMPADTEDEQELAMHAVLSGKAVSAWTSDASDWWQPVLMAGLRVRILKAEPTPHGWAWSSYLERI